MLGATVVLHLLLWRVLTAPMPPKATPPKPVRVSVLRVVSPAAVVPEQAPVPSAATLPAAPARERPQRGRAPAVPEAHPGIAPTAPAVAEPSPPDPSVAGAASAPAPAPGLLDSAATRRAIRETARQRPMSELGDDPARPDRQLSDAMAGAAKGDCLKGEYAGAGMGLLSLPFWALAKLRDQCSK